MPGQVSLFERVAITMLGILPFVVMFLVTSIAMQRERSPGHSNACSPLRWANSTFSRDTGRHFRSLPPRRQLSRARLLSDSSDSPSPAVLAWVIVIAVLGAILGVALGLLASAFAPTEFQAVQFMPVVVVPQLFLCGLLVPRDQLPTWLDWISNVLPLSYAVDALQQVSLNPGVTAEMGRDLAVVGGFAVLALCAAAPRWPRTPDTRTLGPGQPWAPKGPATEQRVVGQCVTGGERIRYLLVPTGVGRGDQALATQFWRFARGLFAQKGFRRRTRFVPLPRLPTSIRH